MQRKIMLHLSDPTYKIKAIKFIDLYTGKTGFMMKGFRVKMWILRVLEVGQKWKSRVILGNKACTRKATAGRKNNTHACRKT
jgi:hypothetical protein